MLLVILLTFVAISTSHPTSNSTFQQVNPLTLSRNLHDEGFVVKLNTGIDLILGVARLFFSQTTVPLPDLNRPIGKNRWAGTFNASNGRFDNLASLERTGDVSFSLANGTSLHLDAALGLGTARASYGVYSLDWINIHQSGALNVDAGVNSLHFAMSLSFRPHCSFRADVFELLELRNSKVTVTGLGVFQNFFDLLSSWLIENFEDKMKSALNKKLDKMFKKALEKKDLCSYFRF